MEALKRFAVNEECRPQSDGKLPARPDACRNEAQYNCDCSCIDDHKEDVNDPESPTPSLDCLRKANQQVAWKELDWLRDNAADNPLITDYIIPRTRCADLLPQASRTTWPHVLHSWANRKTPTSNRRALEGLVLALQSRQVDVPAKWKEVRLALLKETNGDIKNLVNKLAINFRDPEAVKRGRHRLGYG